MTLYTTRARERAAAGRRERAAAMLRANLAAVTQAIKALALPDWRRSRNGGNEGARLSPGIGGDVKPRRWNCRDPYAPKLHHGDYAARVWLGRAMWAIVAALAVVVAWGMV